MRRKCNNSGAQTPDASPSTPYDNFDMGPWREKDTYGLDVEGLLRCRYG